MAQVTFHSMPDSAYLWTAMHVADEKGVTYDFVPLEYRSEEHLKLHPFGKMPVMKQDDFVLYETIAIAHYLDAGFRGPPLRPRDVRGQTEVLRWISIINSYVFPIMNRFTKERLVKPAWGFEVDQAFVDSAKEPLDVQMRMIGEMLTLHPFLVGERFTLADSFLLPHLLFFSLTPEGTELIRRWPAVATWLKRMRDRPTFQKNMMSAAFTAMEAGARARQEAAA
ncbi:MAG TPA: glutathione S-transferase family protein [Rhizomicrobium sp.]|nr:glutathione S-transferase family protein [Rhizomicrobium sp.]